MPAPTLAAYAADWLKRHATHVRPQSLFVYEFNLTRYLLPQLGTVPLAELTRAQVHAAYGALARRGLAPATVHGAHAVLSAIMNDAIDAGVATANPTARLLRGKLRATRPIRLLDERQLTLFLRTADHLVPDVAPIFAVLSDAALRIGEALALRPDDLDVERARLRVERTMLPTRRTGPTKSGDTRVVEISRWLAEQLRRFATPSRRWLFQHRGGAAFEYMEVHGAMRIVARATALPRDMTLHGFRHSRATLWMESGQCDVAWVQAMLGHKKLATTQRYTRRARLPRPKFLDRRRTSA